MSQSTTTIVLLGNSTLLGDLAGGLLVNLFVDSTEIFIGNV